MCFEGLYPGEQIQFIIELFDKNNKVLYETELFFIQNPQMNINSKLQSLKRVLQMMPLLSQMLPKLSSMRTLNKQQMTEIVNLLTEIWFYQMLVSLIMPKVKIQTAKRGSRQLNLELILDMKNEFQRDANRKSTEIQKQEKGQPFNPNHKPMDFAATFETKIKQFISLQVSVDDFVQVIALFTPPLIEGEQLTLIKPKLIQLIENAPKDLYLAPLKKKFNSYVKEKLKGEQVHKEDVKLPEMVHCLILQQIFSKRLQFITNNNNQLLGYHSESILKNVLGYMQNIEADSRTSNVIENLVKSHCEVYLDALQKLTSPDKLNIISSDFCYLLEVFCSVDLKIQECAYSLIEKFIQLFPQLVFQPIVLIVIAEIMTALNRKSSKAFDTKSAVLSEKHLAYQISLPTEVKRIHHKIFGLMGFLQEMLLRGFLIDQNFLKVLVQHLVKQEASISSEIDWGYRLLKYQTMHIQCDRDVVLNKVFNFNHCLWFTHPKKFEENLSKFDCRSLIMDSHLQQLHRVGFHEKKSAESEVLLHIEADIKSEIELEFNILEQAVELPGLSARQAFLNNP